MITFLEYVVLFLKVAGKSMNIFNKQHLGCAIILIYICIILAIVIIVSLIAYCLFKSFSAVAVMRCTPEFNKHHLFLLTVDSIFLLSTFLSMTQRTKM